MAAMVALVGTRHAWVEYSVLVGAPPPLYAFVQADLEQIHMQIFS